jgi:hypothetical protein
VSDRLDRDAAWSLQVRSKAAGAVLALVLLLPLLVFGEHVSAWFAVGWMIFVLVVAVAAAYLFAVWHTNKTVEPMDLGQL